MSISENDIQRAKAGEEQAFIMLYNETIKTAYYVAKRLLRDDCAVEDILQESYVVIYEKLSSYNTGNFQGWVDTIVANRCKNYLRKKNPVLFSQMESDEDPQIDFEDDNIEFRPDEKMDYEETKRLVMNIIDDLPDEQRMSVVLFYYEQMSVKEIAKVFECSENTIKSRLNYGRKSIKEQVLKLEKKGTKLYCMPIFPFLLWMFAEEAKACQVPAGINMADKILQSQDKVVQNADKVAQNADKVVQNADKVAQNADKVVQAVKTKALISAKVAAVLTTGKVAAVSVAVLLGAGATGGVILHNQAESNKIENAAVQEESKEFTPKDIALSVEEKTKINAVLNSLSEVFVYYTDESKNAPMTFEEQGNLVSDNYQLVLRLIKENPEAVKPYCSTVNGNLYSISEENLKKLFHDLIGKDQEQLEFSEFDFLNYTRYMSFKNGIYTFDPTRYRIKGEGTLSVVKDFTATQISEDTVVFHGILKGSIGLFNSFGIDAGLKERYPRMAATTMVEMHFCVTAKIDASSNLCGYRFIGSHCQFEEYSDIKSVVATPKQQEEPEMIQAAKDFLASYTPKEKTSISSYRVSQEYLYNKGSDFEYAYLNIGETPVLIIRAEYVSGVTNSTILFYYYYNSKTNSFESFKYRPHLNDSHGIMEKELYTGDCQINTYQGSLVMIYTYNPMQRSDAFVVGLNGDTPTYNEFWSKGLDRDLSYKIAGKSVNDQIIREKKRELTSIKWVKY